LRGIVDVRRTVVLRLLRDGLTGKRGVIGTERDGEDEKERYGVKRNLTDDCASSVIRERAAHGEPLWTTFL
jgi:hypothetical protein